MRDAACLQFLGAKSEEEKAQERLEEQKVIEARIREREVSECLWHSPHGNSTHA